MPPRPTFIIPIHGTWGLQNKRDWWKNESNFNIFCRAYNVIYKYRLRPFYWSGDVDGVNLLSLFGLKANHNDWIAGGFSLDSYAIGIPFEDRNLIVHSHGLQVVAYSTLEFNNIISVGSPIRDDMMTNYILLKSKVNNWIHIYNDGWDRFQIGGQIGDGRLFGSRAVDIPGVINHKLKGIGHSKILNDPKFFDLWVTQSWFDFLRQ